MMKGDIKIFAKTIEQSAIDQINTLLDSGIFNGSKIRIMPDVHSGAGCVIGFTAELGDKLVPNLIGVDIGCGMRVVELGEKPDSKLLEDIIRNYIPYGLNVREDWKNIKPDYKRYREKSSELIEKLYCKDKLRNIGRLADSVGSLGGGNEDWNYSGPYGAGRLMSRSAAKKELNFQEFKDSMKGIDTWSVLESTIDESPQAYKPMEEIIEQIKDTADIIDIIKPVYNFKASE